MFCVENVAKMQNQTSLGQKAIPPNMGGPDLTLEKNNRVIVVLSLALVLGLFMDFQARRHYASQNPSTGEQIPTNLEESLEEEIDSAREKLESELGERGEEADGIQGAGENIDLLKAEAIPAKADKILGAWNNIKERINSAANQQINAEIKEVKAISGKASEILSPSSVPQNRAPAKSKSPPVLDEISYTKDYYFLYFIRFEQRKSKLIRVQRKHQGEVLRLSRVLENLRKGPNIKEKGLLNNFDNRIQVHSIRLKPRNDSVVVDLNAAMGRMGVHVIHDRMEQLSHTLTQFPQVNSIQLLIDGKAVSKLGSAQVNVPTQIQPQRPSY